MAGTLNVIGVLGAAGADGSHAFAVGVADTTDSIFDSGVFLSPLVLRSETGGGIVDVPAIPEPGTYALMSGGLAAGCAFLRGRRRAVPDERTSRQAAGIGS